LITYAVEPWADCCEDLKLLLPRHHDEIEHDKAAVPFDPDYDTYEILDNAGALHLVMVRSDGVLIGYHSFVIRPHIHSRRTLTAFADVYYVAPEHRKGTIGIRLFTFAEKTLKDRGVRQIYNATTKIVDNGPIFRRLGYTHIEDVYVKEII